MDLVLSRSFRIMPLSKAAEFGATLELGQFPCTRDVVLSKYRISLKLRELDFTTIWNGRSDILSFNRFVVTVTLGVGLMKTANVMLLKI